MARSVAVVEEFIRRNVKIKCGVVTDDFKEGANRIYLNYGHTIGHALERESGYGEIAHGEAITRWDADRGPFGGRARAGGRCAAGDALRDTGDVWADQAVGERVRRGGGDRGDITG